MTEIFTDEFNSKIRVTMGKFSVWYKDHFNFIPVHCFFIGLIIVTLSIVYPFAIYGMIKYAEYWASLHPDVPIDGTIIYLLWKVGEKLISIFLLGYTIVFIILPFVAWASETPTKSPQKSKGVQKKKSSANLPCPFCKSANTVKKGRTRAGAQRYRCKECKLNFVKTGKIK